MVEDKVARLPLECESLDQLLGGGIEAGVITNVYGESGVGKSNICIQAAASQLKRGGKVAFVDTEGSFSSERYLQIYDDQDSLERLTLLQPYTFQEQKQKIRQLPELAEKEDIRLIVFDSLVSLYRLQLNGDDVEEVNQELSSQLSLLSRVAREHKLPVLITAQVYTQFDSGELQMVGRDVPRFWSKTIFLLKRVGEGERIATLEKHRSRPEMTTAKFWITEQGLKSEEEDEKKLF